jgi:hypothetical protein
MTLAQDLQKRVKEEKDRLEDLLTKKVQLLANAPSITVRSSLSLDFDNILVQTIEESDTKEGKRIITTSFERVVTPNGLVRNMGVNAHSVILENNVLAGIKTETSVYSYNIITKIFQIIEEFWTDNKMKEEKPTEEE